MPISGTGLSLLLTILVWWLSTGIIVLVCALPRSTFPRSLFAASLVLLAALYGLDRSAQMTDANGAYLAFLSAIGVWGWLEMTFLMGLITGPRKSPCPPDAKGWRRFSFALGTVLYHELAILAGAALVVLLTWGGPNQTGTLAFSILMVMRISAKLNIFFGVPNLTDQLLPQRLSYLKSYFRKRSFNALFPVSILGASLVAILLAHKAFGAEGTEPVGCALLFALLCLAILEHLLMIAPLPDALLWLWAMPGAATKHTEKPS